MCTFSGVFPTLLHMHVSLPNQKHFILSLRFTSRNAYGRLGALLLFNLTLFVGLTLAAWTLFSQAWQSATTPIWPRALHSWAFKLENIGSCSVQGNQARCRWNGWWTCTSARSRTIACGTSFPLHVGYMPPAPPALARAPAVWGELLALGPRVDFGCTHEH